MTDSPQQQLFLDQFQKVLNLLAGGDNSKALGVLLDVREAGFVNKELDGYIEELRADSPGASATGAVAWVESVVERLRSFEGDVFQLVEELSEASLGISEEEWVPLDHDDVFDDESMLAMDFDDFESLEDFSDADFGFDVDLDDDEANEAFELDIDLDFGARMGSPEEIEELDDFEVLGDIEALDELDDLGEIGDLGGSSATEAGLGSISSEFDLSENFEEPSAIDFSLVENTKNIDLQELVEGDLDAAQARDFLDAPSEQEETKTDFDQTRVASLRETAKQSTVEQHAARRSIFEPGELDDFDDFDQLEELDQLDQPDEPDEFPDSQANPPEFDFDLDMNDSSQDDDDFDFDLGFENPEQKASGPIQSDDDTGAEDAQVDDAQDKTRFVQDLSSAQDDSGGWGGGFDFGFDEDDEFDDESSGGLGGAISSEVGLDVTGEPSTRSALSRPRELDITPAGMPAIPRFGEASEKTSPRLDIDETTNPGDDELEASREREAEASLNDDEFFELAESLAGDSSPSGLNQMPGSNKRRYRGEPLMGASRSNTPLPPAATSTHELSEVSDGRQRSDTPNPFAHQAPTGVQKAVLDSNSSFVLEEIRASEVHEDEAAVNALMNEARRLYEAGKFESAHDLLHALMVREDADEAARELLAAVDGELERVYQAKLGSLSKTPQLCVAMNEIASMNLDHRFGYLLSQIDGMSTFEDILELSSMSRLETLDVLAQMLGRDIIRVG